MHNIYLTFSCLLFSLCVFGQFFDKFDSPELHPRWAGNTSDFIIDQAELRNNGNTSSNTIHLQTSIPLWHKMSWEWDMRLEFNPSTVNFPVIYIWSSHAHIDSAQQALYIKIGEKQTRDSIDVYGVLNGMHKKIFTSSYACMASASTNQASIRIERVQDSLYILYAQCGNIAHPLGEHFTFKTTLDSAFFAIEARYQTSSRKDKFFFDNIHIQNKSIDTIAPFVSQLNPINDHCIDVIFSESMHPQLIKQASLYKLSPVKEIDSIWVLSDQSVRLCFKNAFEDTTYHFTARQLEDLSQNKIATKPSFFYFYTVKKHDILISEIMAKPNGETLLPDVEYIELFNRLNRSISLKGWHLYDTRQQENKSSLHLPEITIAPRQYITLCSVTDTALLSHIPRVYGIKKFPLLNNTSDGIFLRTRNNLIVDAVFYNHKWYLDKDKQQDGGYSLERKSLNPLCIENMKNWSASIAPSGGTPSMPNSLEPLSIELPKVKHINYTLHSFQIVFDQYMDSTDLVRKSAIQLPFESKRTVLFPFDTLIIKPLEPLNSQQAYILKLQTKTAWVNP